MPVPEVTSTKVRQVESSSPHLRPASSIQPQRPEFLGPRKVYVPGETRPSRKPEFRGETRITDVIDDIHTAAVKTYGETIANRFIASDEDEIIVASDAQSAANIRTGMIILTQKADTSVLTETLDPDGTQFPSMFRAGVLLTTESTVLKPEEGDATSEDYVPSTDELEAMREEAEEDPVMSVRRLKSEPKNIEYDPQAQEESGREKLSGQPRWDPRQRREYVRSQREEDGETYTAIEVLAGRTNTYPKGRSMVARNSQAEVITSRVRCEVSNYSPLPEGAAFLSELHQESLAEYCMRALRDAFRTNGRDTTKSSWMTKLAHGTQKKFLAHFRPEVVSSDIIVLRSVVKGALDYVVLQRNGVNGSGDAAQPAWSLKKLYEVGGYPAKEIDQWLESNKRWAASASFRS